MLITLRFLVQWPTMLTVLMFPVLVVMYWRLALREERETEEAFAEGYPRYAERVPRFVPRLGGSDSQADHPENDLDENLKTPSSQLHRDFIA